MNEYMLYIKNDGSSLPAEVEQKFLKACEDYIEELKKHRQLIAAQPLANTGAVITRTGQSWAQQPLSQDPLMHAGYYHIRANDLEQALAIAKNNPEFNFRPSAEIEVHLIKTSESATDYVYPSHLENN